MAVGEAELPRALPLTGASNTRDLGGWPAGAGGRVRFGRVFRGAALTGLTTTDGRALAATGLRTVCDLRGMKERAEAPSRLAGLLEVAVHSLPIEPSVGASLRDILATRNATGEDVFAVMRQAYVAYALDWAHRYRALFELILRPRNLPLLFHCSAGKDRTGFGAALLLTVLGVPYEAVREDYLASNRLWRGDASIAAGLPPEVADKLLRVHAELLDAGFGAIGKSFHNFERYSRLQLGLDATARASLRDLLLD
jgi:protein-tyrosine phosphatase